LRVIFLACCASIAFLKLMDITHESEASAVRALFVTLAALVLIQALLLLPVFGVQRDVAPVQGGFHSRFSIAAVALSSWVLAVSFFQIAVLALPARFDEFKGRALGADGLANPFGVAALALTAVILFGQAEGVVVSLQSMKLLDSGGRTGQLAMTSLFAGAGMFITAAWIIDRFGVKYGFWIALAAQTMSGLLIAVMQAFEQLPLLGLWQAFAPFVVIATLIGATVFVTLLVLQHNGRMEFVALPLILLSLISMQGYRKEMPEILDLFMPLTVALIGLSAFVLLRRAGLLRLLFPLVGTLCIIAMLELWLIGTFSTLELPLPMSGLVASTAVLTGLWHEWRQRSSMPSVKENSHDS
jgi:hypothetical protein